MPYPVISQHALGAALAALVPVPIVDLLLRRMVLHRAYGEIGNEAGVVLNGPVRRLLLKEGGNILVGCLVAALWWPVKKLVRTVVFVFMVKDAFDWFADATLRGLMVKRAADRGLLPGRAAEVGVAMDASVRKLLGSPVTGFLRRRSEPPPPWQASPDLLSKFAQENLRYANGPKALADFEARLDALPPLPAAPEG